MFILIMDGTDKKDTSKRVVFVDKHNVARMTLEPVMVGHW